MYKKHKIHFVGIGGIGMSGIAEVLLNLGYPVSGSDLKISNITRRLKKKGAMISKGHRAQNVQDAAVVVISSAVKENNPEVIQAKKNNIPIIARAEMLAELMNFSKFGVAVAGTHGKTTTTSLIASILYQGNYDPTMIIGGRVNSFRTNARLGKGDFMVAEADESDGSFLKLSPTIAVITNIDREHMEHYGSFDKVKEAFRDFANKVPFYGMVVCCWDHPEVRNLIPQIEKRVVTYGFEEGAQFVAKNVVAQGTQTHFDVFYQDKKLMRIDASIIGQHNVLNALASIAVAHELGISIANIQKALKKFKGIGRRCEVLLKNSDLTIIDDYGHHPVEIQATLQAIRSSFAGRLFVVFQPHRYSRTHDLYDDFVNSFDRANELLVTDIYPAGEASIKGVTSRNLVASLRKKMGTRVAHLPKGQKALDDIIKKIKRDDVVLFLGAGDITYMGRNCAKKLKKIRLAS